MSLFMVGLEELLAIGCDCNPSISDSKRGEYNVHLRPVTDEANRIGETSFHAASVWNTLPHHKGPSETRAQCLSVAE